MKKLTATLLAVLMTMSLCSCGAETEETETESNVASVTEDNNTETTKQTTAKITETEKAEEETTATTTAETTPEVTTTEVVEPEVYRYASTYANYYFDNGSWYFYGGTDESNLKTYYYDIKSKTLNECQEQLNNIQTCMSGHLMNSACAITNDGEIINIVTGEVLYFPENKTCFISQSATGDVIVDGNIAIIEESESISGSTYLFGIMSVDGKWIVPISSENAMAKDKEICKAIINRTYTYIDYSQNGNYLHITLKDKRYSYSIADDTILHNLIFNPIEANVGESNVVNVWSDLNLKGYELGTVDIKTGVYKSYATASMLGGFFENNVVVFNDTTVRVYDYDYNIKAEYDLSAYTNIKIAAANDDYLFFSCYNSEGSSYVCLMNKNGEFEFEPYKGGVSWENAHITDDKLVYIDNDNTFIYYFETKEFVRPNNTDYNSEEYFFIKDYDKTSDLLLVEVKRPDNNGNCYVLSDPDDITAIINPFEA